MATGTVVLSATAGCAAAVDTIGDQILKQVNIINETNKMIAGVITITGPKGQTVLDETFDVPSTEAEAESNFVTYGNVWESSGAYDISVELTNRQVGNAAQTDATVTITDTAKDKLAVAIGFDGADDPIDIRVGQSLSEILKEEQTPQ